MSVPEPQVPARKVFFREAILRALTEEMERDPRVLILGQDVGPFGGPYKDTVGLYERYGAARVRDCPVAEAAMIGVGVGAAAAGLRPVVCITYMDFMMLGLDPLVNYGAKLRFKTGGQLTAPMVIKTTAGAKGQGVAHSQSLEAWLMNVPGLRVVAPATAADAYGLLKTAIRHDGPVVYVDHKRLFQTAGLVPIAETLVPFGVLAVRRPGADVTLVGHSYSVTILLAAAERLLAFGIDAEVLDLRSLAPLDTDGLVTSIAKTGAALFVEEGQVTCGIGAELAFRVNERVPAARLDRLGARPMTISSNAVLESFALPSVERVIEATRQLLARRT